MEDRFSYVKAQLQRRREERQISIVAQRTGVTRRTLLFIMGGRGARTSTVDKLYSFLKENVRKKIL